jgi:hypothetical protein
MNSEKLSDESLNDQKELQEFLDNLETAYATKLDEIKNEVEDVFNIDDNNLVEENMRTVSRLHLWITRHAIERRKLLGLRRKRDDIYSKLHKDYREGKGGVVSLTDKGIDARINLNGTYKRFNALFEEQENIVAFIDQICWALKQTKMNALKNIQDSKRIEGA